MLSALLWMDVETRIKYSILLFVHKIKFGTVPDYIRGNVKLVKDRTKRLLRNRDDFSVDTKKKKSTECTIFHNGFIMFNSLPLTLKKETNFVKFKRLLVSYLTGQENM